MTQRIGNDSVDEPISIHASFAWFGLFLFGVMFLAVLLWSFLDGPAHNMLNLTNSMSDSSRGEETVRRVRLLWEFWPLWGGALAVLLISLRRALNETGRRI